MAEDTGNVDENGNAVEAPYLGTWKTKEDAEEGLANMNKVLSSQGNEVGSLRKQVEMTENAINSMKTQQANVPEASNAPNYGGEIAAIQDDMAKLNPVDDDYHANLMTLMNKSNAISRKMQHEETLTAATQVFKKELDERDVKTTHSQFYDKNPDFNTPEMQTRIKDYIARDTTGMSDPLVAYREIQRDTAGEAVKALEKENTELKRILDLKKGADSTGKVVTKGQSPPQVKQPKTTGADLDKGMQEALNASRG